MRRMIPSRRRRIPTRKGILISATLFAAGLGSLTGSWELNVANPWWAATLGNIGVALLLLVPGEAALSWITSSFKQIEQATDAVRATAESAQDVAERTARSLEDIRTELMDRQVSEHESELDVYRGIIRDPSRESLIRALRHATESGIITSMGVRSPIWETSLHYRFVLDQPETDLEVRLETDDGRVISSHPWASQIPPNDFYQSLVQAVRDAGQDLGVILNDPTRSVQDLAEMLVEVTERRAQALMGYRDHLYKIIERRDGWYFTEKAVLPAENLRYEISVNRLDEMDWEEHLRAKGWYGAGSALAFARSLYGLNKGN